LNLGGLRYHYITPQQNFTQENLKRYSDKTQTKQNKGGSVNVDKIENKRCGCCEKVGMWAKMVRAGVKMCINTVTFCGHGCKKLLERKCERLHFRIFIKKNPN
jgi:hypothetical protein